MSKLKVVDATEPPGPPADPVSKLLMGRLELVRAAIQRHERRLEAALDDADSARATLADYLTERDQIEDALKVLRK